MSLTLAAQTVLGRTGRCVPVLLVLSPDVRGASGGFIYFEFAFVLTPSVKTRGGETQSFRAVTGLQAQQVGAVAEDQRLVARRRGVPCVGGVGAGRASLSLSVHSGSPSSPAGKTHVAAAGRDAVRDGAVSLRPCVTPPGTSTEHRCPLP